MGGGVTTRVTDVLVVGTTLGGLVAGAYLARAGLRVVVLEEDVHGQRPPLLREPFAITGLEHGGPLRMVLEELGVPMIERRELAFEPTALQVALEGARIEVGRGRPALAHELEVYGVAKAPETLDWLEALDAGGDAIRGRLRSGVALAEERPLWERLRQGRRAPEPEWMPALPPTPRQLEPFFGAVRDALAGGHRPISSEAASLLLRSIRDGAHRMPHAGRPYLDLFRRRIAEFHSEIQPAGSLALLQERRTIGFELARGRLMARALVLAVPLEPLGRTLEATGTAPRWLRRHNPPGELPVRLLRAERAAVPVGMARRGVDATGSMPRWWTRSPDPKDSRVEWIVLAGDGVRELGHEAALGPLAPFTEGKLDVVDAGPEPSWDLESNRLRFGAPCPAALQSRPPVVVVGPERAPELGVEGEVLLARATALDLAARLS